MPAVLERVGAAIVVKELRSTQSLPVELWCRRDGMTRRSRSLLRDNGLLLACLGLFAVFFVGMVISGAATYNQQQQEHGSHEQVSVLQYLTTGDFVEATLENWESEFLQMGMYVVLTAFLYQKGSSESKPTTKAAPQDEDPRTVPITESTPWLGPQGRLGVGALRTFVSDRVFRVVLPLVGASRGRWCGVVQ